MVIHTFTCAQAQVRLTQQIFFLIALHRRIIWSSSQLSVRRRPTQRSNSISDRNHTPISGGLSQVCVLEDVSRSCNHQHDDAGKIVPEHDKDWELCVEDDNQGVDFGDKSRKRSDKAFLKGKDM
jgi:hypothetical protein